VSEFLLSTGAAFASGAAARAGDVWVETGMDGRSRDEGGFFGYLFDNFLKYLSPDFNSFIVGILLNDGIPLPLVGVILNIGFGA